jgi:hypothetical protein
MLVKGGFCPFEESGSDTNAESIYNWRPDCQRKRRHLDIAVFLSPFAD